MLLEPMLCGLKERDPLLQLLLPMLPKLGLLLKLRDPCIALLLFSPELLFKLRVNPDVEPLGNTRVESILENVPEGA